MSPAFLAAQPPATSAANSTTASQPAWAKQLFEIRSHQAAILDHLPNYTCTETVERSQRPASTKSFKLLDTWRLEVALVDGKELYGWPGSHKFESTELRDLVHGSGAIATGDFGTHARAIFIGKTSFTYQGPGTDGDRKYVRFGYRRPMPDSGFMVRSGDRSAEVPYYGTIDVDPVSLDVQRIQVIVDDIPKEIGIAKSNDVLEYARVEIGGTKFLLPARSELSMFDLSGNESRNHVQFSSCRQFSGESTLIFDDPPPSAAAPAKVEEVELPRNLEMVLVLTEEIDIPKAAVGDAVHAVVQSDAKSKGRVWIPKNAAATGHITRIERHSDALMVGVTFDDIESPAMHSRVQMRMLNVALADHLTPRASYLVTPPAPGEGIIPLRPGHIRLNRGLLMVWSTEP